jgi:hypothetical protein
VILNAGEHLVIRAANHTRPIIEIPEQKASKADALVVRSNDKRPGGCMVLDGLTITGRALRLQGSLCKVIIRDSTLVPGWGLDHKCEPYRSGEPSLEIHNTNACIQIERSIIGAIRVRQNDTKADPVRVHITDSIIDATSDTRPAIQGITNCANLTLSIKASTVFGNVDIHAIELAENTIFTGQVHVARKQIGCVRFSFVPAGSRTPRRYRCQPDGKPDVMPFFESTRYGQPTYARLKSKTPPEITRGADDESEMGVYHRLYEPQRTDNLTVRLEEFTPAGSDVGLIKVN